VEYLKNKAMGNTHLFNLENREGFLVAAIPPIITAYECPIKNGIDSCQSIGHISMDVFSITPQFRHSVVVY